MEQLATARILRGDLRAIDEELSEGIKLNGHSIVLLKHGLVTIGNLVDFEKELRSSYRTHTELSETYSESARNFEFAKYLRNKFVGHVHPELMAKAIEWKPELRAILGHGEDELALFLLNLFVLETAINTYVDQDGTHKFFDSETDLAYPPDWKRFSQFLAETFRAGVSFLDQVVASKATTIDTLNADGIPVDYWLAAGETEFRFLKKR